MHRNIVTLLSGGLDSATLLYDLAQQHPDSIIQAVSFNYGQRHAQRELNAAHNVVHAARKRFDERIMHNVIDVSTLGALLRGSALTDKYVDVPEGHYEDVSMRKTVVPNRNMVMLSIGASIAIAQQATLLAFAAHAGDHAIYPDCRRPFVDAAQLAVALGNAGFADPTFYVLAPYINMSKTDIVRVGDSLNVPYRLTYSCYNGRELHCGACGTDVERKESFRDAGVVDPTQYEDNTGAYRG